MLPNQSTLTDRDAEIRLALAKVYSLLIKLAEESKTVDSESDQEERDPPNL